MVKELPIGFTVEMVKAVREGRKTVTRRVIIPQPKNVYVTLGDPESWYTEQICGERIIPRYQPGDLLWIKETYCHGIEWDDCKPSEVDPLCGGNDIWYFADGERPTEGWGKKRSSRFMPKWVARTWLKVVSVRPERLQDISPEECYAEGIESQFSKDYKNRENIPVMPLIKRFIRLWDSINAKRGYSWESNPFVWRIEFKELKHLKQGSDEEANTT